MIPITHKEFFLAKMAGEAEYIPSPVTREEIYLAKLCGADIDIPVPVTVDEMYLAALCGMDITPPPPVTRQQVIWDGILHGEGVRLNPINREEQYWTDWDNRTITVGPDDVATFDVDIPAPLRSLMVNIDPVQSGSGDPSPDNVRPITGWTGVQIHRTGENLLSGDDLLGVLAKTHEFTVTDTEDGRRIGFSSSQASSYFRISPPDMRFKENTQYTLIAKDYRSTSGNQNIKIFYTDGTSESVWTANTTITVHRKVSASGKTISYIGGTSAGGTTRLYIDTFGIFEGVVAIDDYAAYQGAIIPITLPTPPGTVYGGTLDVLTGVLTVTMANIDSYAGEAIGEPWISSKDVYSTGTMPTTGAQVVYTLTEPQTYQLTPQEISTLKGQNTIWADTGNVTVEAKHARSTGIDAAVALNILLGGAYTNNGTSDDVSDSEALNIIMGGNR